MQIGDFNFGAGRPLDRQSFQLPDPEKQVEPIPHIEKPLPVTVTPNDGAEVVRIKLPQSKKEETSALNTPEETNFSIWLDVQCREALRGNFVELRQLFKKVISGSESGRIVALLKKFNAFGHSLNFPLQFFQEISVNELLEMSEWQSRDFVINARVFSRLEFCKYPEKISDEMGVRLLRSNLGFALFDTINLFHTKKILTFTQNSWIGNFARWFNTYNPLNLFAREDLAEKLHEIVRYQIADYRNKYSPPDPSNPHFQWITFPDNYKAPLGFYLARCQLLGVFQGEALPLEILFHRDSEGKLLFEHLDHLDEQQKSDLITTCRGFDGYHNAYYLALINAHIEIPKGETTALASLIREIEIKKLWRTLLTSRNVLELCLLSNNQEVFSLIRNAPVNVFVFLKRTATFTAGKKPELLNYFDMFPIEGLESYFNQSTALNLVKDWLKHFTPVAEEYVKRQLDPIRSARLEKLNQFLFQCPLFSMELMRSQYLRLFPKALVTTKGISDPTVHFFLYASDFKARQRQEQYRTTYVHWLCDDLSDKVGKNYNSLQEILKQYPDALDWPDSNGESINDLMKSIPALRKWVHREVDEGPIKPVSKPRADSHVRIVIPSAKKSLLSQDIPADFIDFDKRLNNLINKVEGGDIHPLVEYLKTVLSDPVQYADEIDHLKRACFLERLFTLPSTVFRQITLEGMRQIAELQSSDFMIPIQTFFLVSVCRLSGEMTDELGEQLLRSNLGLPLYESCKSSRLIHFMGVDSLTKFRDWVRNYNPLNLYGKENSEAILEVMIKDQIVGLYNRFSPPNQAHGNLPSIDYPDNYRAPLGFFLMRYNLMSQFQSINLDSSLFFTQDSEKKYLLEYLAHLDVTQQKALVVASCENFRTHIDFYFTLINAHIELDRGETTSLAALIGMIEREKPWNNLALNPMDLFKKCLASKNPHVHSLIRNGSLDLFLYLKQNSQTANPSEIDADTLFDMLPIDALESYSDRAKAMSFIAGCMPELLQIARKYYLRRLDFIWRERVEKLNQFFFLHATELKNSFFTPEICRYLGHFPKALITVSSENFPSLINSGSMLSKSEKRARQQKRSYSITLAHWYCNRRNDNRLKELLQRYPHALDWKDSNGDSVKDLMQSSKSVDAWVRIHVLENTSETAPVASTAPETPFPANWLKNSFRDLKVLINEVSDVLEHNEDSLSERLINDEGAIGIEYRPKSAALRAPAWDAYYKVAEAVFKKRMTPQYNSIEEVHKLFGEGFTGQDLAHFQESPLSDRQRMEVLGAVYHFKRVEFARLKQLRTWNELDKEIRSNLPGSELKKIPILVIRQEIDRVHAEIITGHFTLGNHLVGVTQDPIGTMTQKIQSTVDVDSTFETNEEGDRIVKLTVEGMDRLLGYCREEKGLNLLILPRIDVPAPTESRTMLMPQVRPRNLLEVSREQEVAREVHKRVSEASIKPPKRVKVSPEPLDPEILPEAYEASQKGVGSIKEITAGKMEKDLDEMEAPSKGKRYAKELSPEDIYIPGAATKKQKEMALVASIDDPASFFKNMAFGLIQETIEGVRNANEIINFLDRDGIELPIEGKLKVLPPMPKPFIFSNLYEYQEKDLGRILQLQSAGIYPLISYRMGLGKTYLYVELLMQQLATKPKGIHMVVVPKSVLTQAVGDIRKGLVNAKATAWNALFRSHPEQASELMKEVLNSKDLTSLIPLLPSLDKVTDIYQLRYFLTKTRELIRERISSDSPLFDALTELHEIKDQLGLKRSLVVDLMRKIAQEASKMFVVVEQSTPIDPAQLSGVILFKEENIVEVESVPKKKQVSPFNPGCIVVTKYHQVGALLERAGSDQLDSITLDEAQKVNRKGTVLHTHVQKLIQNQKKPYFSKAFLTATPLENNFEEPATLLELANPEFFPASTFNALTKLVGVVDNQVTNILKPNAFDIRTAVKVFVEHFRLKNALKKTVISLTQKEAARRYRAKFPIPIKRDHRVPFSVSEKQKVDAVTRIFAGNNKLGLFDFVTRVNKILTHDLFENQALSLKSDAFTTLAARIAAEDVVTEEGVFKEVDAVIEESFMLRTLFSSDGFTEVFQEKKKGLLVLDNIVPGELIKLAANRKHGDFCRFYEGSLTSEQRQGLVDWFNEDADEPRLLILSLEAGGVGLNLPKADLVISASRSYNPGQVDQAIARAFRFGYEGNKHVYRIIYENSLFSVHLDTIYKIKKLWVKALFKPQESYKAEFALWMKTRVAEASKLLLNFNKDSENFESVVQEIQQSVDVYCDDIQEEYLKGKIESAIPPVLVTKTVTKAEVERIQIPYGLTREEVALFTYAYQAPIIDARLNALKQNAFNSWFVKKSTPEKLRTPEQSGFPNYRKHIQAVIVHMQALMKALKLELPNSFLFLNRDHATIACAQWPENLDPSHAILLYQTQGKENQPHFEALISKATANEFELRLRSF